MNATDRRLRFENAAEKWIEDYYEQIAEGIESKPIIWDMLHAAYSRGLHAGQTNTLDIRRCQEIENAATNLLRTMSGNTAFQREWLRDALAIPTEESEQ